MIITQIKKRHYSRKKRSHHIQLETSNSMSYHLITCWLKMIKRMPCNLLQSIPQQLSVSKRLIHNTYIRRQNHILHTLISFFVSGAKDVSSATPATMKSRTLCCLNVNSMYSSFFSSFETSNPVSSKTCVLSHRRTVIQVSQTKCDKTFSFFYH